MDRTEYRPSVASAWLITHSYPRCVCVLADGAKKFQKRSHKDFMHCVSVSKVPMATLCQTHSIWYAQPFVVWKHHLTTTYVCVD